MNQNSQKQAPSPEIPGAGRQRQAAMKAEIVHFDAYQLGLVFVNSTARANRFGALEGAGRQEMESG